MVPPLGISPTSRSWTWVSGTWSTGCWTTSRAGSFTTSWTFTSRRVPSTCAATVRASSISRVESGGTRASHPEEKRYIKSDMSTEQFSSTQTTCVLHVSKTKFIYFLSSPFSLQRSWVSSSSHRVSVTWRYGPVRWREPSRLLNLSVCPMNSGRSWTRLMQWVLGSWLQPFADMYVAFTRV